ncbi:MAG: hypothetical protein IT427_09950 [Pirellulales bacterium]|nr:hypothetical protein [Pirellulales bacterium]
MGQTLPDIPDSSPRSSFLERLADRLGFSASAKAVFSDPVECDGVTVIPVAKVRWGFGGGSGRERRLKNGAIRGKDGGGGAGGGVKVAPLGYIEIKEGNTEYKPIRDPATLVPVVVVGGIAGWILLRGLRKLIRK